MYSMKRVSSQNYQNLPTGRTRDNNFRARYLSGQKCGKWPSSEAGVPVGLAEPLPLVGIRVLGPSPPLTAENLTGTGHPRRVDQVELVDEDDL